MVCWCQRCEFTARTHKPVPSRPPSLSPPTSLSSSTRCSQERSLLTTSFLSFSSHGNPKMGHAAPPSFRSSQRRVSPPSVTLHSDANRHFVHFVSPYRRRRHHHHHHCNRHFTCSLALDRLSANCVLCRSCHTRPVQQRIAVHSPDVSLDAVHLIPSFVYDTSLHSFFNCRPLIASAECTNLTAFVFIFHARFHAHACLRMLRSGEHAEATGCDHDARGDG